MKKEDIVIGKQYRVIECYAESNGKPLDYHDWYHSDLKSKIVTVTGCDGYNNVVRVCCEDMHYYLYSTGLTPIEEENAPGPSTNLNKEEDLLNLIMKNLEF